MHRSSATEGHPRLGKTLRLLLIGLVGSVVMGMTAGGLFLTTSIDRYSTPVALGNSDVRGAYLVIWSACAVGLALVALLCLWRRSQGHRVWRYGGAVGLGYVGMLATWFLPSVVMGFSSSDAGATVLGDLGMGLGLWLLTSFYALFYNLANVLLVVPATLDAWYAVLNHGTPEQQPAGAARGRRLWFCALTAVYIGVLACTGLWRGRP